MKIHLDNVNLSSRSGPNSFAKRFSEKVIELGHEITFSGKDADISLVFIEKSGRPLAPKVVQRIDGIWFAPNQFYTNNTGIKSTYQSADYVVWQSEFDKSMITKWWGIPKLGSVIRNGCPQPKSFSQETENAIKNLRERHEKIFVSSANWHPQKRLKSNIELFNYIKNNFHKNSCLVIMGSLDGRLNEKDVYVTGNIPHDVCIQIFKESDWMIHLGWLDHCPNTVVEALSVRTPVICSEDGGTKELLGSFGIVLKENIPYEYQLTDYDNPPDLDVTQLKYLPEKKDLTYDIDVSIESCVNKYLDIFERLLK